MRLRISIFVLASVLALSPPVIGVGEAYAQDMINNTPDYVGAWYLGHIMRYRGKHKGSSAAKDNEAAREVGTVEEKKPAETDVDPSVLLKRATYTPSRQGTATLDAAFTNYLSGQSIDAAAPGLLRALAMDSPPGSPFARLLAAQLGGGSREQILHALQVGTLQHDYAQWLSSMGYSGANLFDVHTAFLMHSWAIANDGVMTADSKGAFGAVRSDLLELQSGAGAPRAMTDSNAKKQEEAQSFALLTALLVASWQHADAQGKSTLRTGVASLGRRIGIDYRDVVLTGNGFSTR